MIDLEPVFAQAGVTAAFHAVDLDTGREVAHHADDLAVTASVFKLPVLIELCRQHATGEIDATRPLPVPVEGRAPGPTGLSVMQDPTTMSLRDLAWLMMGISDNGATDVVCEHVGLDNVNASLRRLGLLRTQIGGDCRDLYRTAAEDVGDISAGLEITWELVEKLRALDPERTLQVSTPREITTLLQLLWKDEAAPAEACAEARRILGLQVWPHRLASGFADLDEVRTSGKTGTLVPTIRNEVGVVEYPDGGRYAVAVFTRSTSLAKKNAAVDAVIGQAARLGVDWLRSG
jgi:beta-lactamase class A